MARNKTYKKRNGTKTQKRKNHSKTKLRKKLGGCACSKKWIGGYGAASYSGTPTLGGTNAASFKDESLNPQNPAGLHGGHLENARNLPDINNGSGMLGGKKRRIKKMKGGAMFSDFLLGNTQNPVLTGLNTSGAYIGKDIIFNNNLTSSYPWDQPVSKMFGPHNPPLA